MRARNAKHNLEKKSMRRASVASWAFRFLVSGGGLALAAACSSEAAPSSSSSPAYQTATRVFSNGNFEMGAAGAVPPSWTVTTNLNANGITVQTPQTYAGLDLAAGGKVLTELLNSATGPQTQPDSDLGPAASLRWPRYGNQCAIVNPGSSKGFTSNGSTNAKNVNTLQQTMTIAAGDVDPADGQVHVRFVVAPVLQNPAHQANEQPYYFVILTDLTKGTTLYSDFNLSGTAGIPWKTINGGTGNEIDYTDWQLVDIHPGSQALSMGDSVELQVIASGCQPGGHFGKVYVDGVGSTIPGLFVSGTAPSQDNACNNLTYTLTYENGGTTSVSGVSVTFNTPPQTRYSSISAPGLTCTTPIVGVAGAVTCNVPQSLAAGASGSFQVTVNVGCLATGTITAGNYSVTATGQTPLLGPHVYTTVGCSADAQCLAGNWCDESLSDCEPTLANLVGIPTDAPHTNPTLNGKCTAAAGALVCTSGVCDVTNNACGYYNGDGPCTVATESVCQSALCDGNDDKCGYANGDGPCTVVNASVNCRSGVCDATDFKCGFATGDGPCTTATAGTVCRSGVCSTNHECEPVGGCNVDADCTGGNWCDETTNTCTPKEANGVAIPTDAKHTAPVLNGKCASAGAALLTCVSGVCDLNDNKCGYANEDGPCTAANGATVCRSGACSDDMKCEPQGGCNDDGDCATGNWCDEATNTCTPKLVNGKVIPTDPSNGSHLNGSCSLAAATIVCLSGVCDPVTSQCGYTNGEVCTSDAQCDSGDCSTNALICIPASGCGDDADCDSAQFCDTSVFMCTPKLANGTGVPTISGHSPTLDGTCPVLGGAAVGASVCVTGVCDTHDNECGYANGDGPCVPGNDPECRSGQCSVALTCEPANGCNVDADCTSTEWCDESINTCEPKLANGTAIPTDGTHLDGTCSTASATIVCVSGVCDTKDNKCGYANLDGPCTAADGAADCRSGLCATTGANDNLCVACLTSTDCTTAGLPACDTTTNTCAQCDTSSECPDETPVCDTSKFTCGACQGDFGSTSKEACSTMTEPFCFLKGAKAGECGKCTENADCVGHNGNVCDVTSGLCTATCATDADCLTSQWCDAAPNARGNCEAKLANGKSLPNQPTDVATCTVAVGKRVCVSSVCDAKTNECGFGLGDGPCTSNAECIQGTCDKTTSLCELADAGVDAGTPDSGRKDSGAKDSGAKDSGRKDSGATDAGPSGCHADQDCREGDFCSNMATCTPELPLGGACTRASECESDNCTAGQCSEIVGAGAGLCAIEAPGHTENRTDAAVVLIGLVFAGVGSRRRRKHAA